MRKTLSDLNDGIQGFRFPRSGNALPPARHAMLGRGAGGDEPARWESATVTMAYGKMYMADDAGLRLRVALLAIDEVGGPLGAVRANWFRSAGARAARTSPMAADQMRSLPKKRHRAAYRADARSADPNPPAPAPTAVPAVPVLCRAEQWGQTNLRGGQARRPRWRRERCTWQTMQAFA